MGHFLLKAATTTTLLLLLFLVVLFSPSTTSTTTTTTTAAATNSAVLDTNGNPIEVNTSYYVGSSFYGAASNGGGFTQRSKPNNPECPRFVARLAREEERGLPVRFYPADPTQKHVHLSSDLNIAIFKDNDDKCNKDENTLGVWQMKPDSSTTGQLLVSTGGVIGNPGVPEKWFKIEDYLGFGYKIVFCPTVYGVCGDIDVVSRDPQFGIGWLGLAPSADFPKRSILFYRAPHPNQWTKSSVSE